MTAPVVLVETAFGLFYPSLVRLSPVHPIAEVGENESFAGRTQMTTLDTKSRCLTRMIGAASIPPSVVLSEPTRAHIASDLFANAI
nr:hypothetical protein [Paraburkholderia sp. BL8N3]